MSERAFGVARVCALGCGLVFTDNEEILSDGYSNISCKSVKKRGDSPKRRRRPRASLERPQLDARHVELKNNKKRGAKLAKTNTKSSSQA